MRTARACAKINLALVVGPIRDDGKHEVVTVLQRIDLCDHVELELAEDVLVEGFRDDTLVATALRELGRETGTPVGAHVRIEKRIPVASGLGGGSSDAATALLLANAELDEPLPREALHRVAARVGADVPFFLGETTMLGVGDGTELTPVAVPVDYTIALVLPHGQAKASTEAVYQAFDERQGARGFDERRQALLEALEAVRVVPDLARLPRNDLAASPITAELEERGALRADVSGAGPVVYGLFERADEAESALAALDHLGRTWLTRPV